MWRACWTVLLLVLGSCAGQETTVMGDGEYVKPLSCADARTRAQTADAEFQVLIDKGLKEKGRVRTGAPEPDTKGDTPAGDKPSAAKPQAAGAAAVKPPPAKPQPARAGAVKPAPVASGTAAKSAAGAPPKAAEPTPGELMTDLVLAKEGLSPEDQARFFALNKELLDLYSYSDREDCGLLI